MKKPFYLDSNYRIQFPTRTIYNDCSVDEWLADENAPSIGVIKGYFYPSHILVFIDDLEIPPIHPSVLISWFNLYENISYIGLGATKGEDSFQPKLVVFRGSSVKFKESENKDIIEEGESSENITKLENVEKDLSSISTQCINSLGQKPKIGFIKY